jgi:hypothetical protein
VARVGIAATIPYNRGLQALVDVFTQYTRGLLASHPEQVAQSVIHYSLLDLSTGFRRGIPTADLPGSTDHPFPIRRDPGQECSPEAFIQ